MKYIRTKDHFLGFYKKMSISLGGYSKGRYYRDVIDRRLHRLGAGILQEKCVIKKSDTIEELCDEFVVDEEIETLEEIRRFKYYTNLSVYGAIWTDKGLIYVAKMNDKGELELL